MIFNSDFIRFYEELSELSIEVVAFLLPNAKNGYLSNWYPSPISIYSQNFSSGEQAFMWAKANTFMDDEIKTQILQTDDPKKLKALGRKIKNYDDTVWSSVRVDLMTEIVTAKFRQNSDLMRLLLATDDAILVEANAFDKFWGCGLRASDSAIKDPKNWPGKNTLGNILMSIRDNNHNKIDEDVSLIEAKQVGLVSYGVKGADEASSVAMLNVILQSDKIKSSEVQTDLYPGSAEDAFVSTSRDLLSHIKANRQRPVGIVLDGDKLSNKYKVSPINWATLELNKEDSRLSLKALYEYTNAVNPEERVYKVQFASYGSFFISKQIFDILEKIMEYYNATETVNRQGEVTTLGVTHGFVPNDRIGAKAQNSRMPYAAEWRITKGYFYSVPNGGGANISRGTLDKYKDKLSQDGIILNNDAFISELIHNKVLDEAEERILQKAVFTYSPKSYTKAGQLRKGAKKVQGDTFFDIKDCIKLILLPITYKNCWDTDGADRTYKASATRIDELSASFAKDLVDLKITIKAKNLENKVFWIDRDTTNAAVYRAINKQESN